MTFEPSSQSNATTASLPAISQPILRWFQLYIRFYLRRNFHNLYLLKLTEPTGLAGNPLLICMNHPSWWDPLIALHLSDRLFADRLNYGPIAVKGLSKYKFFEKLGFFGMDPSSFSGAAKFLDMGQRVLSRQNGAFWVTPQGAFADVRQRPSNISGGTGHLARRGAPFMMLPLAVEYTFWNERFPEAFACFGEPVHVTNGDRRSSAEWTAIFSQALEQTQDRLAAHVQRRDPAMFEALLGGAAGVGGVYDFWRAARARLTGSSWQREHGRF